MNDNHPARRGAARMPPGIANSREASLIAKRVQQVFNRYSPDLSTPSIRHTSLPSSCKRETRWSILYGLGGNHSRSIREAIRLVLLRGESILCPSLYHQVGYVSAIEVSILVVLGGYCWLRMRGDHYVSVHIEQQGSV